MRQNDAIISVSGLSKTYASGFKALAEINLDADDFAWATGKLMDIADRTANGRVVAVLEGGYDLKGLASSAAAHIRQLMTA